MENNQVAVFSTSVPNSIDTFKWQNYLELMPENIKIRIAKFINPKDKYRLLLGRLLLMEGLKYFDLETKLIHKIEYTSLQKPFLKNGIKFNISHSGDIVLCALSTDCAVGIDVEQIRKINPNLFYSTLTPNQKEAVRTAPDKYDYFLKLWTLKESVIKAEGSGLSYPLNCMETDFKIVLLNDSPWFVSTLEVKKGYFAHLASDQPAVIIQGLTRTF